MKIAVFILILLLSFPIGCGLMPGPTINTPFDKEMAERLLQPGTNTIKVNAFARQRGGGIVTCAGFPVALIPATQLFKDYAYAYFKTIEGGYRSFPITKEPVIPNKEEVGKYKQIKPSNSDGNVVFENVADGEFYLATNVRWEVQQYSLWGEGGYFFKLIKVSGGETIDIVLSNIY